MIYFKIPIAGAAFLICLCSAGCGEIGSMSPGQMEWVRPDTQAQRAGTVYLVRGWVGIFSGGMDRLGREINESGVTAHVFQHDQCAELARTMAERYRSAPGHEPICMIGHSFGSDDALVIARELDKVGVPVDLIITMDPVDERVVPKNVKLCVNYWQKGIFGSSNFLRGIPLDQQPGGTGKLINVNLLEDGREFRDANTNHINIDEGPKLHREIIRRVLMSCPERAAWAAMHPAPAAVVHLSPVPAEDRARTAAGRIEPSESKAAPR